MGSCPRRGVVRQQHRQQGGGWFKTRGREASFEVIFQMRDQTKIQVFTHSVDTHSHTHNFPTEDFYAFLYRKVHLSFVDTKAESFKKNSLLPLIFFLCVYQEVLRF